jgi:hypothetical protein
MHSTLQQADPHDVFRIEPDAVPVAPAGHGSPDPVHEVLTLLSQRRTRTASGVPRIDPIPAVDTTFRAAAVDNVHVPSDIKVPGDRPIRHWAKNASAAFVFALGSALAAAAWQHYGAAASQMISDWTPPLALISSSPSEKTGLTEQGDAPAIEAAAAYQASPQSAATAQPAGGAAPATAAPSADAERLQSMARDIATMGQQIEALKASVAELRAGQEAMARDVAKVSDIKASEIKAPATKPPVQPTRPRIAAPRPPAPARRPVAAYYAPVPAAAPSPPLQQFPPPASPPPPAAAPYDGDDPVVRPPMPLR